VSADCDLRFEAMGSHLRLLIGEPGPGAEAPAAAAARERAFVAEFEAALSRFQPQSELCRLNQDQRPRVPASPLLREMVAAGLADRAEVQVAYAIGVARPVSVMVETFGTEKIGRGKILQLIGEHFDLRPGAFRDYLRLHRPIYQKTAAYGHFGRTESEFTWESTRQAAELAADAKSALSARARAA